MTPPADLLNRARAELRQGACAAAARTLQQWLKATPGSADGWFLLGEAHGRQAQHGEAEAAFRRCLALRPDATPARFNLGLALAGQGRHREAMVAFRAVVDADSRQLAAWSQLGCAALAVDEAAAAAMAFDNALQLQPTAELHALAGIARQALGEVSAAEAHYRQALAAGMDDYTVHLNLGSCLFLRQDYWAAAEHAGRALDLRPGDPVAAFNAGRALLDGGEIAGAVDFLARSSLPQAASARLYALNFQEPVDPVQVFAAHRDWGLRAVAAAQAARPAATATTAAPPRAAGRPRIGLVSGDLREHPVAFFLVAYLERVDRQRLEVFVYSDVRQPDAVTARLEGLSEHWREVATASDDALATQIAADGIDVLVDLAGHTGERMLLFARRAAPVQVAYLGYANTSGLPTMDYRITDAALDPPGASETLWVERLLRIPGSCYTYSPPPAPAVGERSPRDGGAFTLLGCHRLGKLSPRTLGLWGRVLRALPGARLLLLGRWTQNGANRDKVIAALVAAGAAAAQVDFRAPLPLADYLLLHQEVDLALDCFPWNGHTVTLHAAWMGVPTLTLGARHHAGRFGAAVMNGLGLPEFVADDDDAFVQRAVHLAANPALLAQLRSELRTRLERSAFLDHARLAGQLDTLLLGLAQSGSMGGDRRPPGL